MHGEAPEASAEDGGAVAAGREIGALERRCRRWGFWDGEEAKQSVEVQATRRGKTGRSERSAPSQGFFLECYSYVY